LVGPSAPASTIEGSEGLDEPGVPEATIDEVDQLLDEVEAALTRLDDGSYGTCRTCGGPIDDHRLADRPTAQTCAPCDRGGVDAGDVGPGRVPAEDAPTDIDVGSDDGVVATPGPGPTSTVSPWSIREFPEA